MSAGELLLAGLNNIFLNHDLLKTLRIFEAYCSDIGIISFNIPRKQKIYKNQKLLLEFCFAISYNQIIKSFFTECGQGVARCVKQSYFMAISICFFVPGLSMYSHSFLGFFHLLQGDHTTGPIVLLRVSRTKITIELCKQFPPYGISKTIQGRQEHFGNVPAVPFYINENMPIPAYCGLQCGIGRLGCFTIEVPPENILRFLPPAPRRLNRPVRAIGDWCLIHWPWISMCLGIPPPYRVAVMVNTALSTRVCPPVVRKPDGLLD